MSSAGAQTAAMNAAPDARWKAPLILVAEDHENLRRIISTRLEVAGYRVITARDGLEAVHQIRARRPDLTILDVNMPRMTGFEALETLSKTPPMPPIMLLTASQRPADVAAARRYGVRAFLAKPLNDQLMLKRVAQLLASPKPVPTAPTGREGSELFL